MKKTPIIGFDGIPKGINVLVMKDKRYGDYEVFRADNIDKLLAVYKNKKELEKAISENNWLVI